MDDQHGIGVKMIARERRRQRVAEGYTAEHDAGHDGGDLALAARCYACPPGVFERSRGQPWGGHPPQGWPWDHRDWKPGDRVRELVKAGALIAAEIDRIAAADPQRYSPTIGALGLSTIASNACHRAGVRDLNGIAKMGRRGWLRTPTVGRVILAEFEAVLARHGLVFEVSEDV